MNDTSLTLAIDLGATSAKMACNRAGRIEVIPNREGQTQTPCAVSLNPQGKLVAGQQAKDAFAADSANVHVDFVRNLGSSLEYESPRVSSRIKPEELTAALLKKLRADAEQFAGLEISSVVVTVPSYARSAQREATERAASLAGFTRCLLIQDALAAAMAAGVADDAGHKAVLIYDFGGSGFNATVLRVGEGAIQVVGCNGDLCLGGTSLDREVVEHVFVPALRAAHPELDLSPNDPRTREVYVKLQAASEAAKLRLSQVNETSAFVSRLCDNERGQPIDFQCELTRTALERLAQPLVERTISICDKVLADSQIAPSEVNSVIPVGGMALMPFVRQKLDDRFGEPTVAAEIDPAIAVVRGAAIKARDDSTADQPSLCRCDVVGQTIGLALSDNEVLPLFEKETRLPVSRTVSLRTSIALKSGQSGEVLKLLLVEGESVRVDENRSIGVLSIPLENVSRDLPPGSEVEVTIETADARQFRISAYVPSFDAEFTRTTGFASEESTGPELSEQPQREATITEVGEINEAINQFKSVMDLVDDGIRNAQHYWEVRDRMAKLHRQLPALKRVAQSDDGRKAVQQLAEAVEWHMQLIGEMQADVDDTELIERHFTMFRDKMESLQRRPISNAREYLQAKEFIENLRYAVKEDYRKLRGNEGRRAMDNLLHQLNEVFQLLTDDAQVGRLAPHFDFDRSLALERRRPEVPASRIDKVHFSVASLPCAQPGSTFIVDVWAHLERQRAEVERRVRQARPQAEPAPVIRPKGPFKIERGTTLFVRLKFTDLHVDPPDDVILWEGEIGNASFEVAIPSETAEGVKSGLVSVHWEGGLQIARVPLQILVAAKAVPTASTTQPIHHIRKAFASYANPDRDEVLRAIQGMQKSAPDLDVFLDVVKLRSGEDWEKRLWQVIPESDVFYLFWSAAAKASPWVEKEWRCALTSRGDEFIDPFPLVSPEEVRPPDELSKKHFNDWILAYRRRRPNPDE